MKTRVILKKSIIIPKSITVEIKSSEDKTIIWFFGVNGSWYFVLPKIMCVSYSNHTLLFYNSNFFFPYSQTNTASNYFGKINTLLTSLQKVITGIGPGYRNFILLRARKCILKPNIKFVKAKVTWPYFVKQQMYSTFKTANRLRVRNKGKARMEQRMPIMRIRSKSYNQIQQWFSTFRKRELPNFYTGQGIRYPVDIVMNRDAHTLKWKERKNRKRMKSGTRRKKKKFAYILTIK